VGARASLAVFLCAAGIAAAGTAAANVSEPPFQRQVGPDPIGRTGSDEAEDAYSRPGGYVGLGGSFAVESFSGHGGHSDSGSVIFRAGFRGLPNLAVELLGEVLPEFDGKGSQDNDVSAFAVTANGKLLLPLGRVEPYVMAGIGILDVDEERRSRRDDFAFRGAGGFDLYLSPHWALYGEAAYLLPAGDVDDFDYATFGGGFFFRF
jgi:opacity protein-like surface antigen